MGANVSNLARCVTSLDRIAPLSIRTSLPDGTDPDAPFKSNVPLSRSLTASTLGSKPRTKASAAVCAGAFVFNAVRLGSASKSSASRPRRAVRPAAARASASDASTVFFAGDIGNARLQVWRTEKGETTLVFENTYGTGDHPTFESCVEDLYEDSGVDASEVTAALQSPDRCRRPSDMTNLSWVVDGPALAKKFGIDAVKVINDFAAVGYGVLDLNPDEIVTLNEGNKDPVGPSRFSVQAPALARRCSSTTTPEGSTVSSPARVPTPISPRAGDPARARGVLRGDPGRVRDRAGVLRVGDRPHLDFLRAHRDAADKPDLDPAGVTDAALDGSCELCVEAVDIFLSILGAEAANLALKCLASGGVYVAGGIPPRLMKIIGSGGKLLDGYLHKACRYAGVGRVPAAHHPQR